MQERRIGPPGRARPVAVLGACSLLLLAATSLTACSHPDTHRPVVHLAPVPASPGIVYVLNNGQATAAGEQAGSSGSVSVVRPDGTVTNIVGVGPNPAAASLAPPGTPNARTLYVPNSGPLGAKSVGTVSVIRPDGSTGRAISVGRNPGAAAVAPAGTPNAGTVYVPNAGDGSVSVIGPDGRLARPILVGKEPHGVAIAPAGTPNAGTVYVITLTSFVTGAVTVIRPDGSIATTVTDNEGPASLAIAPEATPDAGTVYVANFRQHDTGGTVSVIGADGSTGRIIAVGTLPTLPAIAPAGTPNAGTVYVANDIDGSVSVIPPGKGAVHTIGLANGPAGAAAVAPAGTPNAGTVYVPNPDRGTLSVIRPDGSLGKPVTVGREPRPPAVAPAGGRIYVPNFRDGTVSVIRPDGRRESTIIVGRNPTAVVIVT